MTSKEKLFEYIVSKLNLKYKGVFRNQNEWYISTNNVIHEDISQQCHIRVIPSPPSQIYEGYHLVLNDNNECKDIPKLTTIELIYQEKEIMNEEILKKYKSYITKLIKDKGFTITYSNRHCYHIRFKFSGTIENFNSFFQKYNIKVIESDRSCSSKSPTYILKTTERIENIPKGVELYWVNNESSLAKTGSKLFATKDLTPENLMITGKFFNKEELISVVSTRLKEKYDDEISRQLISLLNYAKQKSFDITFDKKMDFTKDDLVVISKDYGEILTAIWIMYNLNFDRIFFPNNSNMKLIDFFGEKLSICYPISVKSGNGSKVFLKNIIDALEKRKKLSDEDIKKQKSFKIIKIVSENTMKSQMILLHQFLQTDMIKELESILNIEDKITLDNIKQWTEDKSISELKEILHDWWEKYSKPRKFDIDDKERLIIAPLGEKIKYILNEDNKLQESLTYLAQHIALLQVNIDIFSTHMYFQKSFFKDGKFKFDWQGYSSGNKLGFKKY